MKRQLILAFRYVAAVFCLPADISNLHNLVAFGFSSGENPAHPSAASATALLCILRTSTETTETHGCPCFPLPHIKSFTFLYRLSIAPPLL